MTASPDARMLAELATRFQADAGESITVQTIVDHAVQVVPEATDVSITLRRRRNRLESLAATSARVEEMDHLQHELLQGPCVDAAEDEDWVRSGDVARDTRWPDWGPRAAAAGYGSLFSVQLRAHGERIGALNLYSGAIGAFHEPETVDLAILYATHGALALAAARLVEGLTTAMDSRHLIGMAQGRLIERYGLDQSGSFALLQRVSSERNEKLRDVAFQIVTTGFPGTDAVAAAAEGSGLREGLDEEMAEMDSGVVVEDAAGTGAPTRSPEDLVDDPS